MSDKFKAIVLNQSGDKFSREVKNLDTSFFSSNKTNDFEVSINEVFF